MTGRGSPQPNTSSSHCNVQVSKDTSRYPFQLTKDQNSPEKITPLLDKHRTALLDQARSTDPYPRFPSQVCANLSSRAPLYSLRFLRVSMPRGTRHQLDLELHPSINSLDLKPSDE
jgi:hypothetical protein